MQQLFKEAQELQTRAENASSEKERRALSKWVCSKDLEAIAFISDSNYFVHKMAKQQFAEIRRDRKNLPEEKKKLP